MLENIFLEPYLQTVTQGEEGVMFKNVFLNKKFQGIQRNP